jgi:exopolysaccharide biosynthesis WecB/TagA/CpsF family protein
MADRSQSTKSRFDFEGGDARRPIAKTAPRPDAPIVPRTLARSYAIDGVEINLATKRAARAEVARRAFRQNGFTLFTLNLDHIAKLESDPDFRAAYERANLITADGWPIVWFAKRDGIAIERTCGADLVDPICEDAAAFGLPTYFIGPGRVAQALAIQVLEQRYPGLVVAGAEAPRFEQPFDSHELDAIATRLKRSRARLCFISLGAPKQELLADRLARACPDIGFICVGAALDFISGKSRRAPRWVQSMNLEWLFRLLSEPRRLLSRYVRSGYLFVHLAVGRKAAMKEAMHDVQPVA